MPEYYSRKKAEELCFSAAFSMRQFYLNYKEPRYARQVRNGKQMELLNNIQKCSDALLSEDCQKTVKRLDTKGFEEYYIFIGGLVESLNLHEKTLFRNGVFVTGKHLKEALDDTLTVAAKVEILEGLEIAELSGLEDDYKEKLADEIRDGRLVSREDKERQIQKLRIVDKYVNIRDITRNIGSTVDFYNTIADLARTEYGEGLQCNVFVKKVFEDYFSSTISEKLFPNGVLISADSLFERISENPECFENVNDKGIMAIQNMADNGEIILMSYKNPPNGHIAFVGHSNLDMYTIRNTESDVVRGKKMKNITDTRWWPVVVQAGVYTGATSMVYATNGWLEHWEDMLSSNNVLFVKIRR